MRYVLFLLLSSNLVFAQTNSTGQLTEKLKNAKSDSAKLSVLYQLIVLNIHSKPHETKNYCIQALPMAERLRDTVAQLRLLVDLGNTYIKLKNLEDAVLIFNKVKFLSSFPKYRYFQILNLLGEGDIYSKRGSLDTGLVLLKKSAGWAEKIGDSITVAHATSIISGILVQKGMFDSATYYAKKSIRFLAADDYKVNRATQVLNLYMFQVAQRKTEPTIVADLEECISIFTSQQDTMGLMQVNDLFAKHSYNNKQYQQSIEHYIKVLQFAESKREKHIAGVTLCNIGNSYLEIEKEILEAEPYFQKAIKLARATKDNRILAMSLYGYGKLQNQLSNYSEAIGYLMECLPVARKAGDNLILANCFFNLGEANAGLSNFDDAKKFYDSSESRLKISKDIAALERLKKMRSELQTKMGNQEAELSYYKEYASKVDKLFADSLQRQLNEFQVKFETRQKQDSIALQTQALSFSNNKRRENWRLFLGSLIVIILLTALAMKIYSLWKKSKRDKAIIEKDKETIEILKKELDHRVIGSLRVLNRFVDVALRDSKDRQPLLDLKTRIKSIETIHTLLRSERNIAFINIQEYFRKLVIHIREIFGRSDSVEFFINANLNFSIDKIFPLVLIVNELVTNSCKYAFPGDFEGVITIDFNKMGDEYNFLYSDNGIISTDVTVFNKKESFGLIIIDLLTQQLKGAASYGFDNGFSFKLTFKLSSDASKESSYS